MASKKTATARTSHAGSSGSSRPARTGGKRISAGDLKSLRKRLHDELLALKETAAGWEWVALYERAYDAYQRGEWRSALEGFRAVIVARGKDGPSAIFVSRRVISRSCGIVSK